MHGSSSYIEWNVIFKLLIAKLNFANAIIMALLPYCSTAGQDFASCIIIIATLIKLCYYVLTFDNGAIINMLGKGSSGFWQDH